MTKEEILAHNKHIVEVVGGAVYRENGECINVKGNGFATSYPSWEFDNMDYELFTPEFSWELFKEGLLLVSCNPKEYERFKVGLKAQGLKWRDVDIDTYAPFSKYNSKSELFGHDRYLFHLLNTTEVRGSVVIQFSAIPPEPRKPETFTPAEWHELTDGQRTACNELIRGEIEYDGGGLATNLEYCGLDGLYTQAEFFNFINRFRHRIKPEPESEYEPYDKPEPWMIGKIIIYKTDSSARLITGIDSKYITVNDMGYTTREMFDIAQLYDPKTGKTRPFGKLKGGE